MDETCVRAWDEHVPPTDAEARPSSSNIGALTDHSHTDAASLVAYRFEDLGQVRQSANRRLRAYNDTSSHGSLGRIPPIGFRRRFSMLEDSVSERSTNRESLREHSQLYQKQDARRTPSCTGPHNRRLIRSANGSRVPSVGLDRAGLLMEAGARSETVQTRLIRTAVPLRGHGLVVQMAA